MGINHLWEAVASVREITTLTRFCLDEAQTLGRDPVVGVDISPYYYAYTRGIQAHTPFRSGRAYYNTQGRFVPNGELLPAGELLALHKLFRRLLSLRAQIVLVFDGPEKPGTKRMVRVSQRVHWMVAPTICLAEAFNFTYHQAPGDAEAELAHLASEGFIDAVLTADSDTLLFGAKVVLRTSRDKSKPDAIEVYRQDRLDRIGFSRGGLLLFALVCGGDYDMLGLPRCGRAVGEQLACAGFGDSLFRIIKSGLRDRTSTPDEFGEQLAAWRDHLCHELATNESGYLGRRYPAVVKVLNRLARAFPSTELMRRYVAPPTTQHFGGTVLVTNKVFDFASLVSRTRQLFAPPRDPLVGRQGEGLREMYDAVAQVFDKGIWVALYVRDLLHDDTVLPRLALQSIVGLRHYQALGRRLCRVQCNQAALHLLLQQTLYAEVRIWVDTPFEDIFPAASVQQLPCSRISIPEDVIELAYPGAIARFVETGDGNLMFEE